MCDNQLVEQMKKRILDLFIDDSSVYSPLSAEEKSSEVTEDALKTVDTDFEP